MANIKKPTLDLKAEALEFAQNTSETVQDTPESVKKNKDRESKGRVRKTADRSLRSAGSSRIFFAPEGDKRLTVNLKRDLHKKLKQAALDKEMTAGELIEQLIEQYL